MEVSLENSEMIITNAKIENFRALKKINVPIKSFSVIIGENDVGKTSFLYALEKFFENKKITEINDFFNKKPESHIKIILTFSNLPDDDELKPLINSKGELTIERTFKIKENPETNAVLEDGTHESVKSTILKKWFSSDNFHFIPVRRDLSVQFSMNKTALLGKMLRGKMKKAISEGKGEDSIEKIQELLTNAIDEPRKDLELFLKEQMQNDSITLGFNDLSIDPVEGVSFKPSLSDDRVKDIPIENRGAGTQNNLIIALFRVITKMHLGEYLILAMEEPENSLHPKAQRQLLSVLQDLSSQSQILITTHSPVFVERSQFESNIIINRTLSGHSNAKTFNIDMLKELREDLGIRPSDTLLKGGGNCALIVEGNTEEDGFPVMMEIQKISEFKLGIAIINAEGSDYQKIKNIIKLLKAYEIPCVVVLDKDAQKSADDLKRLPYDNLEKVFVLTKGTIEDYYPLEIVAQVINDTLSPKKPVTLKDFDASLSGEERLNNFKKVMHDHGCGTPLEYLKKNLGSIGTKILRDKGIELDKELIEIFDLVKKIASKT